MTFATRKRFLALVLEQMGMPYIYNAKGAPLKTPQGLPLTTWDEKEVRGFDCSGLVTWAYFNAGGEDWRRSYDTDAMLFKLPAVKTPRAGDLALYGIPKDAYHVMVFLADGMVVGASGGNSDTLTLELAKVRKACVKVKPSYQYRPDFLGWRQLHFEDVS